MKTPRTKSVDDRLMRRIAAGEQEALRELYNSISGSLYGFALSIVKNPHDADDVMQEAFIRIYTKAGEYTPCGKPLAWVFTITRHLALDKLREQSRSCPLEDSILPDRVADADERLLLRHS